MYDNQFISERVKGIVNNDRSDNDARKVASIHATLNRQQGKTTLLCDLINENSVVAVNNMAQKLSIISTIKQRRPYFNEKTLTFVVVKNPTSGKKLKKEILKQLGWNRFDMTQVYIDNAIWDMIHNHQMSKFFNN